MSFERSESKEKEKEDEGEEFSKEIRAKLEDVKERLNKGEKVNYNLASDYCELLGRGTIIAEYKFTETDKNVFIHVCSKDDSTLRVCEFTVEEEDGVEYATRHMTPIPSSNIVKKLFDFLFAKAQHSYNRRCANNNSEEVMFL